LNRKAVLFDNVARVVRHQNNMLLLPIKNK